METRILRNVKALRAFLCLNQSQFAEQIGVSASLVSLLENGEREPSAGFVAMICSTFHVQPNTMYDVDLLANIAEYAQTAGPENPAGEEGQDGQG